MNRQTLGVVIVGIALGQLPAKAAVVGTAFTYQGQLKVSSVPANVPHDLRFTLTNDAGVTVPGTVPICKDNVPCTNGLFTVELDFGAQYSGDARELKIEVRPAGGVGDCAVGGYTTLTPRQKLTLTPYAGRSLAPWVTSGADISYSAGDVGIGTPTPGERLHVVDTAANADMMLESTNGGTADRTRIWMKTAERLWSLENDGSLDLLKIRDQTAAADRLAIDPDGNVGIGTSSPTHKLEISSNSTNITGLQLTNTTAPSGGEYLLQANGSAVTGRVGNFEIWRTDNSTNMLTIQPDGDIGIGTTSPAQRLDVRGQVQVQDSIRLDAADEPMIVRQWEAATSGALSGFGRWGLYMQPSTLFLGVPGSDYGGTSSIRLGGWLANSTRQDWLTVVEGGNVGIGTTDPGGRRLKVVGSGGGLGGTTLLAENTNTTNGIAINANNNSTDATLVLGNGNAAGDLIRGFDNAGNLNFRVLANGRTITKVLEVTGADLAEKFPVSEKVEAGMVVEIDAANPGQLRLSQGAYNRRVAGVVSGANGLSAGTILGNLPGHEDAPPIALSGRVWVHCDSSNGPIQPGDLLTTSDTPGHAMKVTDFAKAQGAIIGKSMTGLQSGSMGLVLVLVTLQ